MTRRRYHLTENAIGLNEIRVRLGISRQMAWKIAERATFPEPIKELGMGRLWDEPEVEAWFIKRGREW